MGRTKTERDVRSPRKWLGQRVVGGPDTGRDPGRGMVKLGYVRRVDLHYLSVCSVL